MQVNSITLNVTGLAELCIKYQEWQWELNLKSLGGLNVPLHTCNVMTSNLAGVLANNIALRLVPLLLHVAQV